MNVTPTESEAWDIVQMEEIEREFLDEERMIFQFGHFIGFCCLALLFEINSIKLMLVNKQQINRKKSHLYFLRLAKI